MGDGRGRQGAGIRMVARTAWRSLGVAAFVWGGVMARPAMAVSLHQAIRDAWAQDPLRQSLMVDRQAADNNADAARSWFPGGPILSGQYYDDHALGSNQGYTTYQTGVAVPLWLPGQRSATIRQEQAGGGVATAHLAMERMVMAVRVLRAALGGATARLNVQSLQDERRALVEIESSARHLMDAGEISSSDHAAVASDLEAVEGRLTEARERLADERAGLEELTGQSDIPELDEVDGHALAAVRGGATVEQAVDHDPRLRFAHAQVVAARASDDLARRSFMPNPEVGVDAIHEKQYGSPWNTRVGVQLTVPLPSEARNVPMRMKAVREIAAAEREERQTRRAVRADYSRALARLAASLDILRHASGRDRVLARRIEDLRKGWVTGETPVIEYLRARQAGLEARLQQQTASVEWRGAIAQMMIMAGETP